MMERTYQYSADIQQIIKLQSDITSLKMEYTLPEPEIKQIVLVIEELFAKMVQTGSPEEADHALSFLFQLEPGLIKVRLEDNGYPCNILKVPTDHIPDYACDEIDNMEIALIRTFVDDLTYTRIGEKNVYTFQKRIIHT